MQWHVGVDVGGTFTDFFAYEAESKLVRLYKRPSTPHNPAEAIVLGFDELCAEFKIDAEEVVAFAHGTTVATNALIQRRGAKVAMLTTKGFRDLLEIGRQMRPHMYSLQKGNPPALVPRDLVWEVDERITADGKVVRPVDRTWLADFKDKIEKNNVKAVAVGFIFSYLNSAHEREVAKAIAEACPELMVSLSSEVQPEFREYERLSTTVLNAYLQPVLKTYLDHLEREIAARAQQLEVGIYQSSGGLMSLSAARNFPVRTALSGPAAGAVGAMYAASASARRKIITVDMGGTSTDVALINTNELAISYERTVADFPVRMPSVDIHTVGAGGGSIAWVDLDGLLKVGPYSAGAVPGPACYGRGGAEATVTDANIFLGRLSDSGLLNGRMTLERGLAEKAISELADKLGLGAGQTALGIIGIVAANMVRAIRVISVECGHDPREYSLLAFGGAGPLHACEVARAIGIPEVIIPASPGILCAQGLLVSDQKEDFVRTLKITLGADSLAKISDELEQLEARAQVWFEREKIEADRRYLLARFDMRHKGQNFELPVTLPRRPAAEGILIDSIDMLVSAFHESHERSYGFHHAADPIEIVNLRVTCIGRRELAISDDGARADWAENAPYEIRPVIFDGSTYDTPIFDRQTLVTDVEIAGPAIITQLDTTIIVTPGARARQDEGGNLLIKVIG
ncbi:hydantoinase/oxoprolinase family protein [Mesorhizobium sp. WSM3882]|uniref:hydantoinase/oxoprolinase family protein n=1 Tax=Mesorhizobium sp. WSM3882 TaxID=2029407 RepID=UPI000BAF4C63|nr:hydantoinase/oxoprolinase family protein [Mesorhizobium sp. WSM3882]PBB28992.1 methylhydantoinase [Mesorhizobium sp. WSM3882]